MRPQPVPGLSSRVVASGGASYGPELVVNGGFASGANWTINAGDPPDPTISGGALHMNGGYGASVVNNGTCAVGTVHTSVTITSVSTGGVKLLAGDGEGTPRTTAGTFIQDIPNTDPAGVITIQDDGFPCDAVVDLVSVKQVL